MSMPGSRRQACIAQTWALPLCCLLLCLAAWPATAYDNVAVLTGTESAASTEFVQALRKELEQRKGKPIALGMSQSVTGLSSAGKTPPDLVIAVGVQALQQASSLAGNIPVLGVLVPRQAWQKIRDETPATHNLSAITLDQPYPRQLALLRHALPKAREIGLLLSPDNAELESQLTRAAHAYQLKTVTQIVDRTMQLPSVLGQLLQDSDALLAVPDPLVYTRETAQTVLLTSYRHQKPVIGFSRAYVTAGALAAVYSSPEQIARQTADLVLQDAARGSPLPAPQPPRYFSVATNRQVARSLGIAIDSEAVLTDKIRNEETSP